MQFMFQLKTFLTKIKRLNFVLKSLKLCFYILFLIASRDIYVKAINIANICINIFKELKNINAIIAFIDVINSLYIDKNSSNS